MIKLLKKYQIKLTPFDVTKEWFMSNTNNQDLLLMDTTGSVNEPVALEFIDYGDIGQELPEDNFECDIALEQQPDDLINLREGLKTTGIFYPDQDPTNADKTYKRVVYSQIRTMFYNPYNDPTKIWGLENIDFETGNTKRKLSDEITLFDIPQQIFGDKVVPNSVVIINKSFDNDYLIQDDGFGNLIAIKNLFAKQQEIGDFTNNFQQGNITNCNAYFDFAPRTPEAPVLFYSQPDSHTASLSWSLDPGSATAAGFVLERSVNNTSSFTPLITFGGNTFSTIDFPLLSQTTYYYAVYAFNSIGSSSLSNIVYNANIFDNFDYYSIGQQKAFNSGSGWSGEWFLNSINRLIASESFDEYSVGQLNNFNGGYGFIIPWITGSNRNYLAASESFDEYTVGQTDTFNLDYGWISKWINSSGSI